MEYPSNLSEKDKYWFDLIKECRASGKTDHQWLEENNTAAPTFYYHVKKLREKACYIRDWIVMVVFNGPEMLLRSDHLPDKSFVDYLKACQLTSRKQFDRLIKK